jgi:hypothetical protein
VAIVAAVALIAAVTGILWLIQFVLGNEERREGGRS